MKVSEAWLHSFLILTLDEGDWSTSQSDRFTPGGGGICTHSVEHRMGSRNGLDLFEEQKSLLTLPGFETRIIQPAAYSLYRLLVDYCLFK